MQRWHCVFGNSAAKPVAHYQIRAFAQLLDERHKIRKIIGLVTVAHDDITPACRIDPRDQCRAVALGVRIAGDVQPVARPARNDLALSIQAPMVSASLREGIRIVNSTISHFLQWTKPHNLYHIEESILLAAAQEFLCRNPQP